MRHAVRRAMPVLLTGCLLAGPAAAAGGKVRVEFPGRKLAAERKGKRVDYMHLKPGESLTIRASGPVRVNLRVCRVFQRGVTPPPATSLIVARDDGKVARLALDLAPGRKAPLAHDRKLELSRRGTFQIVVAEGDHVYAVTTDTAGSLGLAVRVTKGKKPKRHILDFVEPDAERPAIPVVKVQPSPARSESSPKASASAGTPGLPGWTSTGAPASAREASAGGAGSGPRPVPEAGGAGTRPQPAPDEEVIRIPVTEPAPVAVREREGVSSAAFWTALSAGVVAALASGGMRVWYRQEEAAYDEKIELNAPAHEAREIRDRMVMLERVYIGFGAVAGAAGLTAGILAIVTDWGGGDEAAGASVAPALLPGGGGVSVRVRY